MLEMELIEITDVVIKREIWVIKQIGAEEIILG